MELYLKHDSGPLKVEHKITELPRYRTASGYSVRMPTRYMVKYNGRWRRVYYYVISNNGTCYIGKSLADGIIVDIY